MNRSLNIFGAALLSVVLAMGCNHSTASNAAAASNADQNGSKKGLQGSLFETRKEITIPESSLFEVTLDETLASNRNHAGDLFVASLSQPIVLDGKTIIPAGAHVAGRVVDAKDAGRLHVPARLSVALSSVEVDGKSYDIDFHGTECDTQACRNMQATRIFRINHAARDMCTRWDDRLSVQHNRLREACHKEIPRVVAVASKRFVQGHLE